MNDPKLIAAVTRYETLLRRKSELDWEWNEASGMFRRCRCPETMAAMSRVAGHMLVNEQELKTAKAQMEAIRDQVR